METKKNGRKSLRQRVVDSDSIRELQEQIRKQAEENSALRGGHSVRELLEKANRTGRSSSRSY